MSHCKRPMAKDQELRLRASKVEYGLAGQGYVGDIVDGGSAERHNGPRRRDHVGMEGGRQVTR